MNDNEKENIDNVLVVDLKNNLNDDTIEIEESETDNEKDIFNKKYEKIIFDFPKQNAKIEKYKKHIEEKYSDILNRRSTRVSQLFNSETEHFMTDKIDRDLESENCWGSRKYFESYGYNINEMNFSNTFKEILKKFRSINTFKELYEFILYAREKYTILESSDEKYYLSKFSYIIKDKDLKYEYYKSIFEESFKSNIVLFMNKYHVTAMYIHKSGFLPNCSNNQ